MFESLRGICLAKNEQSDDDDDDGTFMANENNWYTSEQEVSHFAPPLHALYLFDLPVSYI